MVETIGLILAVLAFVVGIWHLREIRIVLSEVKTVIREARVLEDQAQSHASAIDEVKRSLSTRYIGQYPEYLSQIVALIKGAREQIVIFCDCPAYGRFSDPNGWLEYRQEIERKDRQRVHISITCLNKKSRSQFNREQFAREMKDWDQWKQTAVAKERIKELLDYHAPSKTIETLSADGFQDLLEEADSHMLRETFARAEKRDTGSYMPVYFWIVDRDRAIFSIPSFHEETTEYGFITSDQQLISAFTEVLRRYHREESPLELSITES